MPSALSIVQKFFPEVDSVEDGKSDLEIEVTKRITQSAAVKNHKKCAMAVACEKQFDMDGAVVSVNIAYLVKGTKAFRYLVPESVSREVISFDRNGGFAPGSYTLQKPNSAHRLGRSHSQAVTSTGRRKRSSRAHHVTADIRASLLRKDALA